MSERVYPRDSPSPPVSGQHPNPDPKAELESPPTSGQHRPTMSQDSFASSKMSYPSYNSGYAPHPSSGTYVVQVPKDQIYRVPPPENAHKYKLYTQRKAHRSRCRTCCCCLCFTLILLAVLLAVAAAVLYLVLNPKTPSYSVETVHIKGINVSSLSTAISPVFNVTVKAHNRNGKIGIYYQQGSSVDIYHDGVHLCDGSLPAFYQPPKTVTVFATELSGAGIVLSKSAREKLVMEQRGGKVPLDMDVKLPVRIKVGGLKTWTVTVKVSCEITVNALTEKAQVVNKDCRAHAKPW